MIASKIDPNYFVFLNGDIARPYGVKPISAYFVLAFFDKNGMVFSILALITNANKQYRLDVWTLIVATILSSNNSKGFKFKNEGGVENSEVEQYNEDSVSISLDELYSLLGESGGK